MVPLRICNSFEFCIKLKSQKSIFDSPQKLKKKNWEFKAHTQTQNVDEIIKKIIQNDHTENNINSRLKAFLFIQKENNFNKMDF